MKRSIVAAASLSLSFAFCVAGGSARAADAVPVKVFDATELPLDRYTVVKRIWIQTWRSAFWVSTYDEASDAIAALTSKAVDEGANGVINLHCLNDTGGWGSGYFCYGLAIKLK
jgi:uncharacterized protein YbjQ (UPF0145 family)